MQQWEHLNWTVFQQTQQAIEQSKKELEAIFAYFNDSATKYKDFKELQEAINRARAVVRVVL